MVGDGYYVVDVKPKKQETDGFFSWYKVLGGEHGFFRYQTGENTKTKSQN